MQIPINDIRSVDLYDDKRFKPVVFKKSKQKMHLNTSLCIPSYTQVYALAINYAKTWFINNMPKDYFKSIYIEGQHVFGEFKDKNINDLAKKPKPSLAIIPRFDLAFDNEDLNWQYGSKTVSTRITHGKDIFFRDKANNIYIAYFPWLLAGAINFKIRVNSKAKQMDLYKYMVLALGDRNASSGTYMQLDFDVPDELILQLARDAKFEIEEGKVKDSVAFLAYLNSHSKVPFLFKLRNINGKRSYFIRPVAYVHMKDPDEINLDDGERQGQITSNYIIDYEIQIRFPSIQFFKYASITEHNDIKVLDSEGNVKAVYANFSYIPETNSQGWPIHLQTDYEESNLKEPLKIEFAELFANTDLGKLIEYNSKMKLSPAGFLEIHLFNSDRDVPINVDWDNMIITTVGVVTAERSRLVFYLDNKYFNDQIAIYKNWKKTRLNENTEEFTQQ